MAPLAGTAPRSKPELIAAMNRQMHRELIGVDWNFSQYIRDNVMESLSGVKGDNSVKIIGPDLDELEKLADRIKAVLDTVPGLENVAVFRIKGQPNLEFTVDRSRVQILERPRGRRGERHRHRRRRPSGHADG